MPPEFGRPPRVHRARVRPLGQCLDRSPRPGDAAVAPDPDREPIHRRPVGAQVRVWTKGKELRPRIMVVGGFMQFSSSRIVAYGNQSMKERERACSWKAITRWVGGEEGMRLRKSILKYHSLFDCEKHTC